jgi:hypothetical protein
VLEDLVAVELVHVTEASEAGKRDFRRSAVLALSMRASRLLIVIAGLAFLLPASAAAATPEIYVGSNAGYTVVFKVEGSRVSALGLDAPLYCSETGPSHHFGPGTISVFKRPTLMRQGPGGLEALLGGGGGPSSKVEVTFDGTKLTGTFAFDYSEESFHCQTAGFYFTPPEVPFEAVRYEAVGSGATLPPATDEVPVFYGSEGGTEVLLEPNVKSVVFRGAAPSKCPLAGKRAPQGLAPMFGDVIDTDHEGDSFHRTIHRDGETGRRAWSEARSVSGVVGADEIAGFYTRSTTVRAPESSPRRCTTGALPFRAVRYLPAAGS